MVALKRVEEYLYQTLDAAVNLTFRVAGEGKAPVILLHGTSANFAVWNPIADILSYRTMVVSVDQRGHGRSDKPTTGYDGVSFAGDIITILDALGIEKAVLAGHSLGARNAWVAGARYPERVAAVIAVDYVPYIETSVLDRLQTRVAGGDQVFPSLSDVEDYLSNRYPCMPADAVSRRAKWGYQYEAKGWVPLAPAHVLDQVVEGLRTPWDKTFDEVNMPMVCVRGADSAVVSTLAWQKARDARPDLRWRIVDDADHYVPEERPDVIAEEISLVLDTL